MEAKDYLYIVAILLTFLLGVFNLIHTWRISKKTTFINCVTAERVKWINNLRENIANFCGLTHHIVWSNPEITAKEKNEILNEIDRLRMLIPLQLNPHEESTKEIVELLKKIPDQTDVSEQVVHEDEEFPVDKSINELVSKTQLLLKHEWDRVKEEAKKGDITNKPKFIKGFHKITNGRSLILITWLIFTIIFFGLGCHHWQASKNNINPFPIPDSNKIEKNVNKTWIHVVAIINYLVVRMNELSNKLIRIAAFVDCAAVAISVFSMCLPLTSKTKLFNKE